jgi:ribose transport system substrate-binding protein
MTSSARQGKLPSPIPRRSRRAIGAVVACLLSAALAGCGASGGSGAAQTGGADGGACAGTARQAVEDSRRSPDLVVPPAGLDLDALNGKSVWMILAVNTPATAEVGRGFEAAATAAGVVPTVFDGRGAAATWAAGITQAVAQGASGIILLSIPPETVTQPISDAAASGVTVVDSFAGGPDAPLTPGVFAHTTFDPATSGSTLANWVLADSNCAANVLIVGAQSLALHADMMEAARARIVDQCPSCTATVQNVDLATIATTLQPRVEASLRQNPGIGYVISALDAAVTFIQPAVASTGRDVKIVGHDGVATNIDFIRNGSGQSADGALPALGVLGWMGMDQVARGILKMEPSTAVLPIRLVDSTNVGAKGTDLFDAYADYAAKWDSAWRR